MARYFGKGESPIRRHDKTVSSHRREADGGEFQRVRYFLDVDDRDKHSFLCQSEGRATFFIVISEEVVIFIL